MIKGPNFSKQRSLDLDFELSAIFKAKLRLILLLIFINKIIKMYLRYRLDEQGKRVYTFKVSKNFKLSNLLTLLVLLD